MNDAPLKVSESPAYWSHRVDIYPGPVAVTRLAQLIDFDDRLCEAARITYRFLINYYHKDHGDALLSMRHVSKVMRARTPQSTVVLSHSAVCRGIIALMETGWVVRTVRGRGKGKTASRYVPTLNVLDLAALGKLPEKLLHDNEAVEAKLLHANGAKTHILDPRTIDSRGQSMGNSLSAAPTAPHASGLTAAAAGTAGFERVWKAYGKLGNKKAAREAFAAIEEPDVEHLATRRCLARQR